MGEDKISSLLIKFSIPAIAGTLINALYNVVDRIFVGRAIGDLGIAATAVSFPMMMILMGLGMLIGFGSSTLISIHLGEKNLKQAQKIFGQALVLFFILSLFFGFFIQIWLKDLLLFFGASENVLPYARDYMRIILFGTFFHLISFGVNSFIRAEGKPTAAMITMFLGAGLNIIFDYILIIKLNMGMKGAAIGTIGAQIISSLWVLRYFLSSQSTLKIRLCDLRIDPALIKRVIAMGSPQCIFHLIGSFVQALMNNQLFKYGGDIAISSMGVIFSVSIFVVMPMIGLSQAMQPIVGFNYGAKKMSRAFSAYKLSCIGSSVYSFSAWLLIMIFSKQMVSLFTRNSTELIQTGSHQLKIFMFMIPLVGFIITTASFFQAIGKPGISLLLNLGRQTIILIPLMYLFPLFFGLDGVVAAMPASDAAAFITSIVFINREKSGALSPKIS
jgi:putative MATE family efflux protein